MPSGGPNFSPFPFAQLRTLTRREAAFESALARWCRARPHGAMPALASLLGAPVRARVVGVRGDLASAPAATAVTRIDPHAALAEVRLAGHSITLVGASHGVRKLAQHVLGGPDELPAPRRLTPVEDGLWSLVVATALEDLGIAAEVWPQTSAPSDARTVVEVVLESARFAPAAAAVETLIGVRRPARVEPASPRRDAAMTVLALCPPSLTLQVAPAPPLPAWSFELAVVVARSAIPRRSLQVLRVRDIVTVEATCELVLGEGRIPLSAPPRGMEATVSSGYVPRDMALPDEAHLELTVECGQARLSLRQLAELVPGQIIPLGRPLAGPYEVRAGGRLIGHGELVDVEGELGIRIVSLVEE